MSLRSISIFLFMFGVLFVHAEVSLAQDEAGSQAATTQLKPASNQEEEKLKRERKAVALLEEVVSAAQALKLPENRVRVQIVAGDILWARNRARARELFNEVGAAIAQMRWRGERQDRDGAEITSRLRRELVLTAAKHDADFAFQLLNSTRPLARIDSTVNDTSSNADETSLAQSLLSMIASNDPQAAYQKAVESLERGEYPTAIGSVLWQLYSKD